MRFYLTLQIAAFWPVWRWYIERVTDSSDEPWGVLALVTAVLFIALRGKGGKPGPAGLALSSAALLLYIVLFPELPALARGTLAMVSIGCILSPSALGRSMHIGVLGLLLLSLPVIASLQFYLGYPVRALTSFFASGIISATGYPTEAYGAMLQWAGEYIAVDAPCSGVRMLWTGLYLNFTLACFTGLGQFRTWLSYICSAAVIFTGNMLRVTALFYLESGIVKGPKWAHESIGLVLFGLVAFFIILLNRKLVRYGPENA
jgi:exosortase